MSVFRMILNWKRGFVCPRCLPNPTLRADTCEQKVTKRNMVLIYSKLCPRPRLAIETKDHEKHDVGHIYLSPSNADLSRLFVLLW